MNERKRRKQKIIKEVVCSIVFLATMFVIGLTFTSCCGEHAEASDSPFTYNLQNTRRYPQHTFFIDPETGVHYILVMARDGITITPRLNRDGTLYVEERGGWGR